MTREEIIAWLYDLERDIWRMLKRSPYVPLQPPYTGPVLWSLEVMSYVGPRVLNVRSAIGLTGDPAEIFEAVYRDGIRRW